MGKPSNAKPPQGVSRRAFLKSVGVGAAATGLAGAPIDGARAAQPTILILPLRGGEGTELAPLGEGLADLLTIDLARQQGVSVV